MALTIDYHEIVQDRIRRDPKYGELLLNGAVESLLTGEVGVARIRLRDYIIATVGFEGLGTMAGKSTERLVHLFGPEGAPSPRDLFEVIDLLAQHEGVHLEISAACEEQPTEVGASGV